ncbi:MAG: dUTPase, partial [Nitrososphaerales archaeon]
MVNVLEEIFRLQKEYMSSFSFERYPKSLEERISALCTAIIHEAAELQDLTSWKWWKTFKGFEVERAKEEIVDILHFLVQACIEMNLSPNDILNLYRAKNYVNRKRAQSG